MPEHQQTQQSTESKTTSQKQATPRIQTPISNPMSIIQRARMNPKSLTHADVMQLQSTIGNRAVVRLLTEIGAIPSKAKQAPPVQRQELVQRQEIPEEEEPLQGKFESGPEKETCPSCMQRQEIPEEEEPLQGKMIGTIQRQEIPEEEEPLQGKFENKPEIACPSCFAAPIVQKQEIPEEEEPFQGKFESIQRQEIPEEEEPLQTKRENNTGMPDNLKAGVENLSRIDMSDVRVHYNSSKPAEVGALAYTQGTNIHVAPGQERHLPHEAWHVVQQFQSRVRPMIQLKDGVTVNDDEKLEHEADVMGKRAFNSGQDVFFQQGMYEPGSWGEQELIAHELTHVVQKNGGGPSRATIQRAGVKSELVDATSKFEYFKQSTEDIDALREDVSNALYNYYKPPATPGQHYSDKTSRDKTKTQMDENTAQIKAQSLNRWTDTAIVSAQRIYSELLSAVDLATSQGLGGEDITMGMDTESQPDVYVGTTANEVKRIDSPMVGAVDKHVTKGSAQLAKRVKNENDGSVITEWHLTLDIANSENPWPFTPSRLNALKKAKHVAVYKESTAVDRITKYEASNAKVKYTYRVRSKNPDIDTFDVDA